MHKIWRFLTKVLSLQIRNIRIHILWVLILGTAFYRHTNALSHSSWRADGTFSFLVYSFLHITSFLFIVFHVFCLI